MKEDFVTFELAKKLKNKGYPQVEKNTLAMYDEDGCLSCLCPTLDINRYYYCFEDFDKHDYVAPTISQVLKWLREEKNIFVVVLIDDDSDYPVTYNIFNGADCVYHHHENYYALSEWSKCEMAGIGYVIDNLI